MCHCGVQNDAGGGEGGRGCLRSRWMYRVALPAESREANTSKVNNTFTQRHSHTSLTTAWALLMALCV